jgi:hypothetical protein
MDLKQLEADFAARVREACDQSRALGHPPSRLESMLRTQHAVNLAKKLMLSGDIHSGLKEMVRAGHPELTLEAIMLQPEFAPIFSAAQLQAAAWRLSMAAPAA